ncbi:uncharacterized protein LOC143540300 [Bidens hawaiensis]|uniref:uncharacterized protein LOC143540300 n=1 Tax=Bidens hawaiensis TaxID=980011 RepID=UPI00404B52DB
MTFGLKNAGATYQRLMDNPFHDQIGKNLEVYMDDLVIKSVEEDQMLRDIEDVFSTLRKINMKLNPSKCSFGMEEGKFLGVIVTGEGFKANPEKVQAIARMLSPSSLKEVQTLNGRLVALNRFLANHAAKSLPINITKLRENGTFQMDIGSRNGVARILLTDRKTIQTPIYYVSRTLADVETRYSMLEKLVLALVYAARRLKRLAKWAIELGEHSIEYKPRPVIKGQVLADFVTEVPTGKVQECLSEQQPPIPSDESQQWTLFMDGASSGEGPGAGLKLINPDGQEFTYSIKLNFKSTNIEAEYEAFLAGLRIAKKLGVKFLEAWVDSMLITGQVSYLSQAKDLMQQFTSCKVVHIKRIENRPADALSKLASTSFEHMGRNVRIEVLDAPSVPQHQVRVIQTGATSWMEPIRAYLSSGILPEDKAEARKIRHKALWYQMHDEVLFRKSFLGPLLRCVDADDANYIVRAIHDGICGLHAGPRMMVAKIMNAGYYWPGMHMDALKEIRKCDACQRHAPGRCDLRMT